MNLYEGVSALPSPMNNKTASEEGNCIWLYTEEEFINYLERCSNGEHSGKRKTSKVR